MVISLQFNLKLSDNMVTVKWLFDCHHVIT